MRRTMRLSEAKVNDFDYRWPGRHDEAATLFTTLAAVGTSYFHIAGEGRGFRDAVEAMTEPFTTQDRVPAGADSCSAGTAWRETAAVQRPSATAIGREGKAPRTAGSAGAGDDRDAGHDSSLAPGTDREEVRRERQATARPPACG